MGFGIFTKFWSFLAGPVTLVLIGTYFSPETQGFHYTFASLLALSIFAELGLGIVIVQFSSHEWAHLSISEEGSITGDPDSFSRLVSIGKFAFKWFILAGIFQLLLMGAGGYLFFSSSNSANLNWVFPWMALCFLSSLNLISLPFWSILEGCNQVSNVYFFRFVANIFYTISAWGAIYFGFGLWTSAVALFSGTFVSACFILGKYRQFFRSLLFSNPEGPRIIWKDDLLPVQWKIAVSWLSGYLIFSMFTPILFKFQGPEIAGKMGMTWSIIYALFSFSGAWIAPQMPRFGIYIARKEFDELDKLFYKLSFIITGIITVTSLTVWLGVFCLFHFEFSISSRLLGPFPTAFFLLGNFLIVSTLPMATYLRAHRQEPLMALSVLAGLLMLLSNCILGFFYSADGIAVGFLGVHLVIIPCTVRLWYNLRNEWHNPVNPLNE